MSTPMRPIVSTSYGDTADMAPPRPRRGRCRAAGGGSGYHVVGAPDHMYVCNNISVERVNILSGQREKLRAGPEVGSVLGEELGLVPERLEFQRVAGRIAQEHRPLLPRFSGEPQVRLD